VANCTSLAGKAPLILPKCAAPHELIGSVELCVRLKEFEHFGTELKPHGLGEVPVLLHGQIPVQSQTIGN